MGIYFNGVDFLPNTPVANATPSKITAPPHSEGK